jgi:hypothetical protein
MPERTDKRWAPAHAAQGAAGLMAELGEIARAKIGQFVILPITPDVLDRVEFRGVARQPFDHESAALRSDEVADQPRPVCGQPVPYHQELAREVAQQMAEEVDHLRAANGAWIEAEVEAPPGDPGQAESRFQLK